jgi:hypothetical protein
MLIDININGVYFIKCNYYNFEYESQTGKTFKDGINGHFSAHNNQHLKTMHCPRYNHNFLVDNLNILHVQMKGKNLSNLDAFEMVKASTKGKRLLKD